MRKPLIILAGPTASGKSALALLIAKQIDAVIINSDSKQVYKEIPVITAQPSMDEMEQVPHKMYGCISAARNFSVADWIDEVKPVIEEVYESGKTPMLVGGTGMYIKYLTEGIAKIPDIDSEIRDLVRGLVEKHGSEYVHKKLAEIDEVMAGRLSPGDSQRVARAYEVIKQTGKSLAFWQEEKTHPSYPQENCKIFFLSPPKEEVYDNCNKRFVKMVEGGVIDEVKALDALGLDENLPAMKAHGVPEIRNYLRGLMSLDEAIDQAQKNTRHYIKRQFTWFRGQMKGAFALENNDKIKDVEQMLAYIEN